jgi:3-phenylpropionate/trans-cinnamate dioxygenase ferredoxin component
MPRIRACSVDELDEGAAIRLDCEPPIAVFRTATGYYAIDDTCSHAKASLSEGYLEDDVIECPVHMAGFCLRTGRPMGPPATKPVSTYPVTIDAGNIHILIRDGDV